MIRLPKMRLMFGHEIWWLYVIQSMQIREDDRPGVYHAGITRHPARRLLEYNGGAKDYENWLQFQRPWVARALFGPYFGHPQAKKAERDIRKVRSRYKTKWSPEESLFCWGLGVEHPWVKNSWEEPSEEDVEPYLDKVTVDRPRFRYGIPFEIRPELS